MKFILTITASIIILLPVFAIGQIDQGIDGLGLYIDPDATINFQDVEAGGVFELYLMATNLSSPTGLDAVELSLFCPESHVIIGELQIPQPGYDWQDVEGDIVLLYTDPVPYAPVMLLATIIIYLTETEPAELFIKAANYIDGGSLYNDLPLYIVGGSVSDLRSLYPSSGSVDSPVFRINGGGPVAVTNTTLDGVKALYR